MTRQEYVAIYKASRDAWPKITVDAMKRIRLSYVNASKDVVKALARAEKRGLSELTIESLQEINKQLSKATIEIQGTIEAESLKATGDAYDLQVKADKGFLGEAVVSAGAKKITAAGINRMAVNLKNDILQAQVARSTSQGYIIKTAGGFQQTVLDVINAGLARGQDPAKIAKELTKYIGFSKEGVWGQLKPEEARYYQRLPNEIDWKATRIVRSEIGASMHQASIGQTTMNPGTTGQVDWVRSNEIDFGCNCPDNAKNGPYDLDKVPPYDHPNCACTLRPVTRDARKFTEDLKRWTNGESVEYLDAWYKDVYLTANV